MRSAGGIVASQSRRAAEAGAAILAGGGNAVDAAIATGMALAAAEPWMSGLGGGGHMIVRPADGRPASLIDFAMIAPRALDPARYGLAHGGGNDDALFGWPRVIEDRNVIGPDSIAVPGHVDGLGLACEKFGRLPWAELLAPAIDLAEEGILLDWFGALSIAAAAPDLARFAPSRRQYLTDGLAPMPDGEGRTRYLPLGELAKTLKHLAASGPRDFYEGEIARSLVGELRAAGSCIGLEDFAGYRAAMGPPLEFDYRGVRIATSGDLSAGPTLKRVMGELGRRPVAGNAPSHGDYLAHAAALRLAYDERLARDGAAGGRRILPAVAEILSFVIDFAMDLERAFHHPRLDESAQEIVTLDGRLPADLAKLMEASGPVEMGSSDVFPLLFGCASAVMREGVSNIGMAEVTSPWTGAVAERGSSSAT